MLPSIQTRLLLKSVLARSGRKSANNKFLKLLNYQYIENLLFKSVLARSGRKSANNKFLKLLNYQYIENLLFKRIP